MYQLIQQQNELSHILSEMEQTLTYALDSEFVKVDTLWPKLGLFQINVSGKVYLLDGVHLDLTEFWQKLQKANQNIFHACSEDIDLFYHYSKIKPLHNIFDTQLAMSFLGHGLQVSYQNALQLYLNIEIEKDHTRSDWTARPLSQEQLCYAANDVEFLPTLAEKIKQDLQHKQLLAYVEEDCRSLAYEISLETPTDELYKDVGNYRHSRRQLMQLQQLSVWREQLVKALNIPRSFVLKNNVMIELVEKNPKNQFQLSNIKGMRPNIIREYGKVILDLLKFLPEKDLWPLSLARPVKQISKEVAEQVDELIECIAQETKVPRAVLMRKKWLNELYHHVVFHHQDIEHLSCYLKGWRYPLLVEPLLKILQADKLNLTQQMKIRK
ncbi:ribonuclease D [Acinetobacter nectaris]|uniref:ribonuclease D n=1 Tax=Acinetobacter nectaris TaxID=1219382 RepID=UPI001EFF8D5E|nr:HRDC domain-containing protein [Acinetobacter nectaris]MCF8998697.1 HRDC domain-containing protein [Acinetobacter nectaris]MCF9026389.1 HRDC domain-containing protein [Acinetobacter nectaris]